MPRLLPLLVLAAVLAAGDAPATVRVPLAPFGIAAGTEVSIDGKTAPAEAAGLPLPPGRAVTVAWNADGREQSYPITAVTAATGDLTPAWHKDGPRQEGTQQVVVGTATMKNVMFAMNRALIDARMQAARNSPGTTTTITEKKEQLPDGTVSHSREIRSTTSRGTSVTSQTRDLVILVSTDPAVKQPVTCWVRIAATVEVAPERPETPAERKAREGADKAFADLNRKIDEEMAKPAAPAAEEAAKREAEEAAKREAEKAAAPKR